MTQPPAARNGGWPSPREGRGWPDSGGEDGWGPSTAVYSGSAKRVGRAFGPPTAAQPERASDPWAPAGPRPARDQRAVRATERDAQRQAERAARQSAVSQTPERGLPWWGALLVLIGIAAAGGLIDTLSSSQMRSGFNVGIVVASVVAIIAVRRSHMFPVVIAPPIVYSAAAILQLYVRSSGLHDKKVIIDAAANYLVYGFPAIAAATAAVLIIAGVRLITRK